MIAKICNVCTFDSRISIFSITTRELSFVEQQYRSRQLSLSIDSSRLLLQERKIEDVVVLNDQRDVRQINAQFDRTDFDKNVRSILSEIDQKRLVRRDLSLSRFFEQLEFRSQLRNLTSSRHDDQIRHRHDNDKRFLLSS